MRKTIAVLIAALICGNALAISAAGHASAGGHASVSSAHASASAHPAAAAHAEAAPAHATVTEARPVSTTTATAPSTVYPWWMFWHPSSSSHCDESKPDCKR